jgi:Undecaprenyl-phosphate galactose phosphotransferase WbaP
MPLESELPASSFVLPQVESAHSPLTRPFGKTVVLSVADTFAIMLSLLIATAFRNSIMTGRVPVTRVLIPTMVVTISSLIAVGLYNGICENPVEEIRRSALAMSLAFLSLMSSTYLHHDLSQSRLTVVFAWFFSLFFVPLVRNFARGKFAAQSWWQSPALILGAGKTGKLVMTTLRANPHLGLRPIAVLDDNPTQYEGVPDDLLVGPLSDCLEISRAHRISYAIICMPGLSRKDLLQFMDRYGNCFGHVMVIPDLIGIACLGISVREIGGILGLEVSQKLLHPAARSAKRCLDLIVAVVAGIVVLPLVVVAAIAIKLESRGPAFYANERIGYGGNKFRAWKLRSMVIDGEEALSRHFHLYPDELSTWEKTQKLRNDPRVTRVGRVIRKASIDELPQLWNVLVGEMSLVGPRPFLESQIELYGSAFTLYKRVRPGITGLWQISGRNRLTFEDRVRLDAYTIQNWSVWLDIYILARTVRAVFTAEGAY